MRDEKRHSIECADLGRLGIVILGIPSSLLCNTVWKRSWRRQSAVGGSMNSVSDDLGVEPFGMV